MNRAIFYDVLRGPATEVFGKSLSQEQVNGIEGILDAMAEVGDGRDGTLCYALATAYHETGCRMVPVREGFASSDEGAIRAVQNLAKRLGPNSAPSRYGKPAGPYRKTYYGRGHVQLTWLDNYERCSADAGVDLVQNPDAMLESRVSARILILGLIDGRWNSKGLGIEHYLPSGGVEDLKNARRTVNGVDRWEKVASYYGDFRAAVTAAGGCPAVAQVESDSGLDLPRLEEAADNQTAAAPPEEWLAACPGDARAIGKWLARMPALHSGKTGQRGVR